MRKKMVETAIKIGYWNCRGFIEPIKLSLEYLSLPYELITHECGPSPHFDIKDWVSKKDTVLKGFDFPNLPYYQDENHKITQYMAIMQYLARKHGLLPDSKDEKALIDCDILREVAVDIIWTEINYIYFFDHRAKGTEPGHEEKVEKRIVYRETVSKHLAYLNTKKTKDGGKYFLGDKVTYVDILLFEFLDHVHVLEGKTFMAEYPAIKDFMQNFQDIPSIRSYQTSTRYRKCPLFGERSFIGREENDAPVLSH